MPQVGGRLPVGRRATGAKAEARKKSGHSPPRRVPIRRKKLRQGAHLKGGCYKFKGEGRAALLLFVEVFGGDVVLGDLVGADWLFVGVVGVFDALDGFGLEGAPFLEEFVHAFGIGAFDVG